MANILEGLTPIFGNILEGSILVFIMLEGLTPVFGILEGFTPVFGYISFFRGRRIVLL